MLLLAPFGRSAATSNNGRLRSSGDNNQRSKHFCSSAVLCVFDMTDGENTRVIRFQVMEGPNA